MFFLSGCVLSEGHHYSHSCSSPAHLPLLWQPHLECGPQGELDPQVPLLWYQGPFQEGRHSVCDMFLTFMYWRIDNQLHKLEYIIWNEISCSECQYNFFVGDPHHSFCLHWPDNSARYKYLRKTVYGWQMFFFVCVCIHCRASLSEWHTTGFMFCHGTQTMVNVALATGFVSQASCTGMG